MYRPAIAIVATLGLAQLASAATPPVMVVTCAAPKGVNVAASTESERSKTAPTEIFDAEAVSDLRYLGKDEYRCATASIGLWVVGFLLRIHGRSVARLPDGELAELMLSVAELGAVGRNLSQIARVANRTGRVIGVGLRQMAWCAQSMTPRWVE
jgi:hypothetical protein